MTSRRKLYIAGAIVWLIGMGYLLATASPN